MKNPLSYQVEHLLKANKILIDFNELEFQIQSHPTYPSLHAVTGVLDHFNIENLALDVPVSNETLNQLSNTFLAQIEIKEQKSFAVVTKTKNNYKLVFSAKEKKTLSPSEFSEQFTGIILAVAKNKTVVNSENSTLNPILIKGLALITFIIFGLVFVISNSNPINLSFLSLSILGIYITVTILKQEQGESTILGDAFCSNPTEKKSCNAVLSSKAATVYKHLKLSDLSFMYFTGLALATFLLAISNNTIFITKLISILALPITVYSIYYQSLVIKKWCFLCLSIVVVMWCQASLSITSFHSTYNLESTLIVVLSFSFITAFWLYQSKILKDNRSFKKMKIEDLKFKRNFDAFKMQLDKSTTFNTHIASKEEIVFGKPNSGLNVMIITNPLCGHCKPVHQLIENILNSYSQSVKVTVRFNVNLKNPENLSVKITTRLLEIYHVDGASACLKAMHEIYGNTSSVEWFKKWEHCKQPQKYLPILKNGHAWCSDNAINFTPELLINGTSFPKIYDRKDLIYFIEDLVELHSTNTNEVSAIKTDIFL